MKISVFEKMKHPLPFLVLLKDQSMKAWSIVFVSLWAAWPTFSQIPNAGFEHWVGDSVLVGWGCNNCDMYRTLTPTTLAHSGNLAAQGTVVSGMQGTVVPTLYAGVEGQGFAYALHPRQFSCWYKFATPVSSGDYLLISVTLSTDGAAKTPVASGLGIIRTPALSFNKFFIPLSWISAKVPDSAIVRISIARDDPTTPSVTGSLFVLDDMAFEGLTDVQEDITLPRTAGLEQNYPNPFNPTTTIGFSVPPLSGRDGGISDIGLVKLAVYDVLGREVAVLVNEQKSAGSYEVKFSAKSGSASGGDGRNLASGVYFYRLTAGPFSAMKKMVLTR